MIVARSTVLSSAASLITVLLFAVVADCQAQTSRQATDADAWPSASVAPSGLSDARMRALDNALHSGEFKKVGSVLIARHGKLVYEAYLDGDPATLRDTRSATKA